MTVLSQESYNLPRGTRVQMNLYSVHRNAGHWGPEPEAFRPDRFLDARGQLKPRDNWLMPFGYGSFRHNPQSFQHSCIALHLREAEVSR